MDANARRKKILENAESRLRKIKGLQFNDSLGTVSVSATEETSASECPFHDEQPGGCSSLGEHSHNDPPLFQNGHIPSCTSEDDKETPPQLRLNTSPDKINAISHKTDFTIFLTLGCLVSIAWNLFGAETSCIFPFVMAVVPRAIFFRTESSSPFSLTSLLPLLNFLQITPRLRTILSVTVKVMISASLATRLLSFYLFSFVITHTLIDFVKGQLVDS